MSPMPWASLTREYRSRMNPVSRLTAMPFSDRDAKQRWENTVAGSSWTMGVGGLGGQLFTSAVKNSVGKLFG